MYSVTTIITPIQYATRLSKAVDRLNDSHRYTLINLDTAILNVLHEAREGLRNKTIQKRVRNRIHCERFNNALTRLIAAGLIHRTEHGRSVYYAITHKGKNVLKELNEHLIALVQSA